MSVAADVVVPRGRAIDQTTTGRRTRVRQQRGRSIRTGIQAGIIVVWCLLPFYWMIVTSFRQVDYTYDTTPWPTHFTLDNYATALSTDLGNHLGQALLNSLFIGACVTIVACWSGFPRRMPWRDWSSGASGSWPA